MRKGILLITSIFLCCIFLFSCAQGDLPVYVYSVNENVGSFRYTGQTTYVETNPGSIWIKNLPDRTLALQSEEIPLSYNKHIQVGSRNYARVEYQNDTYSMTVSYHEKTGEIDAIDFGEYPAKISEPIRAQNQLLEICDKIFLAFMGNREGYRTTVKSQVTVLSENRGLSMTSYQGYVAAEQYENSNVTYYVYYIFYLDDISTADCLLLAVTSDGYLKIMSKQMVGEFDGLDLSDQFIEKCDTSIDAKVSRLCDVEGYQLQSYHMTRSLACIDGKIFVHYLIEPQILETKTASLIETGDIELLISLK